MIENNNCRNCRFFEVLDDIMPCADCRRIHPMAIKDYFEDKDGKPEGEPGPLYFVAVEGVEIASFYTIDDALLFTMAKFDDAPTRRQMSMTITRDADRKQ